ncbi:hypothetical protein CDW43_09310 [Methylophaga nitratireducenticrescens]|nr:hypothetical protein CDW43_09310 [Methylophaga nitratireducenticrescens]
MRKRITDEKISKFRDLINSNSSFVFHVYRNIDGKNNWNLICSCMDWITVSIRHLQSTPELEKNIDARVMQMFTFISSIDLVFEAIKQLHRVFINDKSTPFEGEKECFADRLFDEDDNTYFKSIRASYGAHPVNLNKMTPRLFASWPFDSYTNSGDLTVHLYSSKVNEEDLVMNLNSAELFNFLIKRYEYLDVILIKINEIYEDFKTTLRNQPIEAKTDYLEHLYTLKIESKRRLDNDYYRGLIDELIMIFEEDVTDPKLSELISDYKKSLIPLIEEIEANLQNMNIVDLVNDELLESKSILKNELSYELGKFYSWVCGDRYDPLIDYYLERFNKATNYKFMFDINDSNNLLFIKTKLMLLE